MPDNVEPLMDKEHHIDPSEVVALPDTDIAALLSVVRREDAEGHPSRAMEILYRARPQELSAVASEVVEDPQRSAPYRALALHYLVALDAAAAEPRLRTLTTNEEPAIRLAAIRELGAVGSAASLTELARLTTADDDFIRRLAVLSAALVAFRSHQPGFEPQLPPPLPPDRVRWDQEITVAAAPGAEAQRVVEQVRDRAYGSQPSIRGAREIQCGRVRFMLLPDQSLVGDDQYRYPRNARQLAAIVARRAEVAETYATSLLVLTWPEDQQAQRLGIFRTDGLALYGGRWAAGGAVHLEGLQGGGPFTIELAGTVDQDFIVKSARSGRTGARRSQPSASAPLR